MVNSVLKLLTSLVVSFCLIVSAVAEEVDQDGFVKITTEVYAKPLLVQSSAPTVIIIHGGSGSRGQYTGHTRTWAGHINSWGYNAVIVDLFSARGLKDLGKQGQRLPFSQRANDIDEIVKYIKTKSWHSGHIGLVGFSQGGSTILEVSTRDNSDIKAGVALYPACGYVSPSNNPKFHIEMHLGLDDDLSLPHLCNVWSKEKYSIFKYEGATHAFDIRAPDRVITGNVMKYNKEAADISKSRAKNFLDAHLK